MRDIKNNRIVEVYTKNGCNISNTCKALKISRQTFYEWKRKDENLNQMLEEAEEAMIDFAESKLIEHIDNGDVTSLIFFLKTKGKKRGYVEKTESDINVNTFQQMMQDLPD